MNLGARIHAKKRMNVYRTLWLVGLCMYTYKESCLWMSQIKPDYIGKHQKGDSSTGVLLDILFLLILPLVSEWNGTKYTNPCQERPSRYETHTQLQCPTWQLSCCFPLCFHSYPRVWLHLEAPYVVMYTCLHRHRSTQELMLLDNAMDKR